MLRCMLRAANSDIGEVVQDSRITYYTVVAERRRDIGVAGTGKPKYRKAEEALRFQAM